MLLALALLLAASGVTRADADRLSQAGRYAEAAEEYLALLRITPRDAGLLDAMGQTLRRMRRPEVAARFFREEVAIAPADREALRSLGAALQESNTFEEARKVLEALTQSEPEVGINWFRLGLLMYQNAYYPAAVDDFDRAIALRIAGANRAEVVRAISLIQAGRASQAFQVIPALLARPENARDLDLILVYVQALYETGNYIEALKQNGVALAAGPSNATAHFWRARIFQHEGRIRESIEEAEKARELAPASPAPRNLLVRLYRKVGRETEAEAEALWLRRAEAASNGRQINGPAQ